MYTLLDYCRARKLLWDIRWENTEGMHTHTLHVGVIVVGSVYKHQKNFVASLLLPGVKARLDTYSYTEGSEEHILKKARDHVEASAAAWFLKLEQ